MFRQLDGSGFATAALLVEVSSRFLGSSRLCRAASSAIAGISDRRRNPRTAQEHPPVPDERNFFAGAEKVCEFWSLSGRLNAAELAEAAQRLPRYKGAYNAYFCCERLAPQFSPNAESDLALAAWQAFTKNSETDSQFNPQFVRPDLWRWHRRGSSRPAPWPSNRPARCAA
jgi:hypothetical protein